MIMAAAVADYRPEQVAERKIKKETQGDALDLRLVRNPDILARAGGRRDAPGRSSSASPPRPRPDRDALLALGRAKAARKGVDYLVVNRVGWTEGFATERNAVIVLDPGRGYSGRGQRQQGVGRRPYPRSRPLTDRTRPDVARTRCP